MLHVYADWYTSVVVDMNVDECVRVDDEVDVNVIASVGDNIIVTVYIDAVVYVGMPGDMCGC